MSTNKSANLITSAARMRLGRKLEILQKQLRDIGKKKGEAAGEFLSDWHDNAAYEQLDREFQMLNQRISELSILLGNSMPVDILEQSERVGIGTTVDFTLDSVENRMTIGCIGESEPEVDLIAYGSPLGRLLMGMKQGEIRRGRIGAREVNVKVQCIHPPSFRYNAIQQELNSTLKQDNSA